MLLSNKICEEPCFFSLLSLLDYVFWKRRLLYIFLNFYTDHTLKDEATESKGLQVTSATGTC